MRCVGSSPAAAARALKTRAQLDPSSENESALLAQTLDDEELSENDIEPGVGLEDQNLHGLIDIAERLSVDVANDPKFKALCRVLDGLLKNGHSPVIFVDILPRQNKSVLLFKHLRRSIPSRLLRVQSRQKNVKFVLKNSAHMRTAFWLQQIVCRKG